MRIAAFAFRMLQIACLPTLAFICVDVPHALSEHDWAFAAFGSSFAILMSAMIAGLEYLRRLSLEDAPTITGQSGEGEGNERS